MSRTIKISLFALLLIALLEGMFRLVFHVTGYAIGKLVPPWMYFNRVDSLVVEQQFYIDDAGIYRARKEYWEKQNYRLNREGFRGREFVQDTTSPAAKRLLFIGDSFTWGAHADSSFVDMLDNKPSFVCYNASVPGNDPPQYERLAAKYVPVLRPDYTIVMFFIGNDLMDTPRQIVPGKDLYYQTNAGWLPSYYEGIKFASAQESYDYFARKYFAESPVKKILMTTATGTAVFSLPRRLEEYRSWIKKRKSGIANEYLQRIRRICEGSNSHFLLVIIPTLYDDLTDDFYKNPFGYMQKKYPRLFMGLEDVTLVLRMQKTHYWQLPDGHFNYKGHEFVAGCIQEHVL